MLCSVRIINMKMLIPLWPHEGVSQCEMWYWVKNKRSRDRYGGDGIKRVVVLLWSRYPVDLSIGS